MMGKATTIPLDSDVRDRLRSYGTAGMTYSDIVTALLDKIEMEKFLAEMQRRVEDPAVQWIRHEDMEWD